LMFVGLLAVGFGILGVAGWVLKMVSSMTRKR